MSVLNLSIDLTKIDKSKIKVVTKQDGKQAMYLNLSVIMKDEEADQYGNHGFVSQDVTKEERDAGKRGMILGNVKWAKMPAAMAGTATAAVIPPPKAAAPAEVLSIDDLPF